MKHSRYNIVARDGDTYYLTNLVSRSILELSADAFATYRDLATVEVENLDPELGQFLQVLRDGFFVLPDDFDELQYVRYRVRRERFNSRELKLVIAPTLGCNFACHYCFEAKNHAVMSEETQSRILQLVATQLPGREALAVQWFGGEPLQALDVIERLSHGFLAISESLGAMYVASIVTNGHFLTEEVAANLSSLRVQSAQVTLEGNNVLHDRTRKAPRGESSYSLLLRNIVGASHYMRVRVRVHVAPFSLPSVRLLIDELSATDVVRAATEIYFAPLFKYVPGSGQRQFVADARRFFTSEEFAAVEVELYKAIAQRGFPLPELLDAPFGVCTAVQDNTLVVAPNGILSKCYFDLGVSCESIGSLEEGVRPSTKLLAWMDHEIARDDECRACTYLPVCFGGCTKKWHEGAAKATICTPLRYNAESLIPLFAKARRSESAMACRQ